MSGLPFSTKDFCGAVNGGTSAAKMFADLGKSVVSVKPCICGGILFFVAG